MDGQQRPATLAAFSARRAAVEAVPEGHLLAFHNRDVPGVLGKIGTVLGDAGLNIGNVHLSRNKDRTEAFALLNLDSEPGERVLEQLRAVPGVLSIRHVRL